MYVCVHVCTCMSRPEDKFINATHLLLRQDKINCDKLEMHSFYLTTGTVIPQELRVWTIRITLQHEFDYNKRYKLTLFKVK